MLESYIVVVGLKIGQGIDNKFFLRRLIYAAFSEFGIAVEMIVGAIEEALLKDSSIASIDNFAEMYRSRIDCVDALDPFVTDDFKVIDAGKLLGGVDLKALNRFAVEGLGDTQYAMAGQEIE